MKIEDASEITLACIESSAQKVLQNKGAERAVQVPVSTELLDNIGFPWGLSNSTSL
jgi:hypothetical protein